MGGLEEKGFELGGEAVCSTRKRRKKEKKSFNAVCLLNWTDIKILSREPKVLYLSFALF